ncbi:MAG TPA: EF-Tu/IF-2/RF-3 family GTPase, partial [Candidatus Binatia bacterium]|nr:EF-Tu/IF-2/RF-3 family GTPase [Candidatus Binatia bacterium]
EIRQVFNIQGVGTIAGCYVTEGKIQRGNLIRLLRDQVVIHEGKLASLKRFKDDVREVAAGYECGLSIEAFQDIKQGDTVEAYEKIPVIRRITQSPAGREAPHASRG